MKLRSTEASQMMKLIDNFSELGSLLHVKNNHMAYARKFRDDLRRKLKIGKRTVYASKSPLSVIQRRLGMVFNIMMNDLPYNEVAIAYRPGVNVAEKLAVCQGSAIMIKTDIRHYYDNISYAHIEKALMDCGMIARGARLVASYCTIWNGRFSSLQQGSACSPALANIVGNRYFDRPIVRWLRDHCPVEHTYYRYSDNLVLFCKEEPGNDFINEYKEFVKTTAARGEFRTHSWSSIRNNHPTRHQEFLGIVLNEVANISRVKRDRIRAILWNAVVGNTAEEAKKYFADTGELPRGIADEEEIYTTKFMMAMQGYVAYARMIQDKFANRIAKLLMAVRIKDGYFNEDGVPFKYGLGNQHIKVAKLYKDDSVGIEEFRRRLLDCLSS